MANPVFNRLEKEWSQTAISTGQTPNGYPTMPGYQPGASPTATVDPRYPYQTAQAGQSQGAGAPTYSAEQMAQYEAAMSAPAADAVDRRQMTYDDVIVKSGISFGLLLVGAFLGWTVAAANPGLGMMIALGSILIAFVCVLVVSFSKTIRPAVILTYAGFEGFALGAISGVTESVYPGIVIQALLATAAVFGVTLALFASGKVRNSPKLAKFTLIALVGILVYRILDMVLSMTGLLQGGFDQMTFMGLPLGLIVGLVAVVIGALCLIQDFDQVKVGVQQGAPAKYAWMCAFGIMVTVVWLYLEILRILSYLRND
ncbi:Bax inhibitor-1/YccA family protein [Schaalia vaccimaxillae]|uniref:Bax inhibitor-1/YccA family protein n=1 Tax=Schaalia vaccimaxillae TaxID=183916 RepID=UPI0003B54E48|nr:Bax inhibitor-1/YccA family protein [Schaalia vaccimaxillae]